MTRPHWIIIGLAYIVGLWSTNWIGGQSSALTGKQWIIVSVILTGLAVMLALILPRIKTSIWVMAVMVALSAVVYWQWRIPQPEYNDISYQITGSERQLVKITGTVLTEPRLRDQSRLKFWLQASSIDNGEPVTGKLYVTLPLLQGTGIYPGQHLNLTGLLYLPQPASNPHSFDFQQYLARQGIFAGIRGIEADFEQVEPPWGWWKLRQRIVRSHLQGLGSPKGQLVSSMVLGHKAVDLPRDIRDLFIEAGLAHVLAASGFHVSLLLGIILKLTSRITASPRLIIGTGTLIIYLGLTGIQASVLRACLMGFAVLLASTMNTKVKPLGSLLLAAVVILLFNPLLISDLGLQLSFLATLGLIVTLPTIEQRLDWLPTNIATLIAIPLAASLWVLPLLCYEFNTLATYSIVVNILATPLITVISLGGMISGILALILPTFGSGIAQFLFYPVTWLIAIANFATSLPGSRWAVGEIPVIALLAIYGLFILVWRNHWWQKRWWLGLMLPMVLLITTLIHNSTQVQITVLGNRLSLMIVVQDQGQVILINSGQEKQGKYSLLPFLARQGINHIDYGLASDDDSNSIAAWSEITQRIKVNSIFSPESSSLSAIKTARIGTAPKIKTKSATITIDYDLGVTNLHLAKFNWLILSKATKTDSLNQKIEQYIKKHNLASQPLIIISSGNIAQTWLKLLQPQKVIISGDRISTTIKEILQQNQIKHYHLASVGLVQWTPEKGFREQQERLN